MDKNASRIYLIGPDGKEVIEMGTSQYTREADFQSLLARHPALIDGAQINPDQPRRWLLVSQEASVPDAESGRWSLDHLFVDQDGVATLVEVKRKSDTRLRREVVGQMLDYAANGSLRWTAAYLSDSFAQTCMELDTSPEVALLDFLQDPERAPGFWEAVESNLRAGRMRLLFVADEIPEELQRIVEFLNERMSPTEVLALELRYFTGGGYSTHVPRVLGRTLASVAQKEGSGHRVGERRAWDRDRFVSDLRLRCSENTARQIEGFLDLCSQNFDIAWGTGAQTGSFTPRRNDLSTRGPVSIYSDGRVEIKPSWLNDTPEAIEWSERIRPRLAALGWNQTASGNRELSLRLQPEQWLPHARELFDAIC